MPVTREDLRLIESVVSRFIGGKNYSFRDDIVSDGMLALAEAVQAWDETPAARRKIPDRSRFLGVVIRRRCIDGIRRRTGQGKNGQHPRREFEDGMVRLDRETNDRGDTLLERFVGDEDTILGDAVVEDLLERLPEREREVVRRTVIEGETEISVARDFGVTESRISQLRAQALRRLRGENALTPRRRPGYGLSPVPAVPESLSARELQVLSGMADGLQNREIASSLVISEETVKGHVRHILAKLRARSRTHAVAMALREGVIT